MSHLEKAALKMPISKEKFITIEGEDGVAPKLCFQMQTEPVTELGETGIHPRDMLEYLKLLFISLNEDFPCSENLVTIDMLELSLIWQDSRGKK